MSEHTKEPWGVSHGNPIMVVTPPSEEAMRRIEAREFPVTSKRVCVCEPSHYMSQEECEANARRIAACVNACAEIETERLEEIVSRGDVLDGRALIWKRDSSTRP